MKFTQRILGLEKLASNDRDKLPLLRFIVVYPDTYTGDLGRDGYRASEVPPVDPEAFTYLIDLTKFPPEQLKPWF